MKSDTKGRIKAVPSDRETEALEELGRKLLLEIGEDPGREGLVRTPLRFAKMFRSLTRGYRQDPVEELRSAIFRGHYRDLVLIRAIPVYSLCEHHILPFLGRAHVAYLADGKIVGLSKIPRMVDGYCRRLQVQERLTHQIAQAIQEVLEPRGVAVTIEASHLCMQMRGVEKPGVSMVTSVMLGAFDTDPAVRMDYLTRISNPADRRQSQRIKVPVPGGGCF